MLQIDAKGIYYRQLNEQIKGAVNNGETEFVLDNINGQRYIGTGIDKPVNIVINGVAGSDLGAFMDGPIITVNANGQDAIGNTMNAGKITIHGTAGDVIGYAMRGGKLFIKGNVGYRVGIHMKEYQEKVPAIIAGGTAGDFFGEYMAGGILVALGIGKEADQPIAGDYCGTGMHNGVIYLRGDMNDDMLGKEVKKFDLEDSDWEKLEPLLREWCADFDYNYEEIVKEKFIKLIPVSLRPYGRMYAY